MKRGGPLRRTAPLRSSRGIVRGKPIRVRGVNWTKAWAAVRRAVYERDGGLCVACGTWVPPDDFECHHRLLRSQGGKDNPGNLVTLHHECHDRAHRDRHWSRQRQLILRPSPGIDPASVPVTDHTGRRWLLSSDGTRTPYEEAA